MVTIEIVFKEDSGLDPQEFDVEDVIASSLPKGLAVHSDHDIAFIVIPHSEGAAILRVDDIVAVFIEDPGLDPS